VVRMMLVREARRMRMDVGHVGALDGPRYTMAR